MVIKCEETLNASRNCNVFKDFVVKDGLNHKSFLTLYLRIIWTIDNEVNFVAWNVASLPEQSCPKLDPNDAKDKEDKETEEEDVAQHGQGV